MLRVLAPNTQSEATDSYVPSKASPTSSPLAFKVADPELPLVMCTSLKKSTGTSPIEASAKGEPGPCLAASSKLCGALKGGLPVFLATIEAKLVNAPMLAPGSPAGALFTCP